MSDLARHLAVSLPTMSKSVDMLVRRRLVERYPDEKDRRQTMIRATATGRRAALKMKERAERHVAGALAPLAAAERAALLSSLAPVKRALAPRP
jgi:DNA-binding MarR family transcriptional regulator